ncbi:cadherin-related family member 4-like [Chanos chanos]|uniref:Cadherin-related family member 4-like n=1 Tax=Chanos chanos TaxID=29144 RepID=A0A6J2VR82_CHACN|nr:cadherin-related family member 4 [Chanos chanos]
MYLKELRCHFPLPGFIDLPASVDVLENTVPRKVVVEFKIESSDPRPEVRILSITPFSSVFETPAVNPTNASNIFTVQMVLNGSVDFEQTRLYSLSLGIVPADSPVLRSLNIRVINVNDPPECEPLFQLPGAEVHIPEDHPVHMPFYTVLARDPDKNDTIAFSICRVLPESSRGQFYIDGRGSISSNQSFDYHNGPRAENSKSRTFSSLESRNVSIYENGGAEDVVASVRANSVTSNVLYAFVKTHPAYKIGREDGIIRTAFNLDLETDRTLTQTILLVRALSLSEGRSGTATVTINVLDVNEHPPFCSPPVFVLTVPETTEIGRRLGKVTCFDIDISKHKVSLTLIEDNISLFKFRLRDGQLQVNNSLDYDVANVANNNFQYEATILATDAGSPSLTSEIRIFVTVTPVNEFVPQLAAPFALPVPENARRGSVVGVLKATDADWPFDSVRFSIPGDNDLLAADPATGQLYLRKELDFEEQHRHTVTVQLVDFGQDVDRTNSKTGVAEITIQVENVNDNAPICNPVAYESTIYSTLAAGVPILTLNCNDPDGDVLTTTITNGAAVDRFQMNDLSLSSKNMFSYVPDGVYDDSMFVVTIEVSDGKYSANAVAYITVVPWTTTVPTTTTKTTRRPPQVVTMVTEFWDPELWFVVVLTVTGALLLFALGLLTWAILLRAETEKHAMTDHQPASPHSDQRFDGKAQDPGKNRVKQSSSFSLAVS